MPAKLDTLPWLARSLICDYLDDDDDDDDHVSRCGRRSDLHAFSLTSRQCCAASASRRFCQVRMTVATADELLRALERCADMLDRGGGGGRYRYVQRLKIVRPEPDEEEDDDDEWERRRVRLWRLAMPRFCRPPPGLGLSGHPSKLKSTTDEPWLALARFIGRLPALKDLVWGFRNMPQPVLTAVHAAGACRLHMHGFWLDSVVVSRSGYNPQVVDVDPDDYALATSPALSSIVARVRTYEDDGRLNYAWEALLGIAAGAAPNLQHVWLSSSQPSDTIDLRQTLLLGRPPAAPNNIFSPNAQAGSPRSLCFRNVGSGGWAARIDLSKLAHLKLGWDAAWVDVAARLVSLRDLTLSVDSYGAPAVSQLLTTLNPNSLQSLCLYGHINEALFNTLLDQHGQSLRRLSLLHGNSPPPPFALTPAVAARLAEACPNVEFLELRMDRTRGDARECGVYRALGALPRLRRLSLTLRYTMYISKEVLEDDGSFSYETEEVPRADLSRAFADAAFDAALARSIFDLVSPGGSGRLQHLRLEPEHTAGRHRWSPYGGDQRFHYLLRWLGRSWICERPRRSGDGTGTGSGTPADVKIREDDPCGTHWHGEEIFIEAFGDVWPQTGAPRWW
ncbi:hypothetical protein C8A05DRAFT_18195, partial [Staphylotrichum tortipilum]